MTERIGELAALGTAVCWTFTALAFESAGRRVGSLPVNLIRLIVAFALLTLFGWIRRGLPFPVDASAHAWGWLALSALAGFCIGDLCLFRAFVLLGARLSVLLMSLVPPMTALIGWVFLDERLSALDITGMGITTAGVTWVAMERRGGASGAVTGHRLQGLLLGLGGAIGQAAGLILSKHGMAAYDAFAATQIRVLTGILGFAIIFTAGGVWPRVVAALKDRPAMRRTCFGGFFGPFLGVSLSLYAVQHTLSGVAATIMGIVPVLIIPPSIWLLRETVSPRAIAGALLAVGGTVLLFVH